MWISNSSRSLLTILVTLCVLITGCAPANPQVNSLVSQSFTTGIIYTQPVNSNGGLFISSWWDPVGSDSDQYIWDDFTLSSNQSITDIQWVGGYDPTKFGAGGPVLDFSIKIYASIVGGTQPDVTNPPLASYQAGGNAGETFYGLVNSINLYSYSFTLPAAFNAISGTKYWIQVEAYQHGIPGSAVIPDWGIASGTGGDGKHFSKTTSLLGDPNFYQIVPGDTAFTLLGPVPGKATPTITWANPTDITFGTALSEMQLNATASVPGTFVYNPDVGTVLNAGAGQILSVDFTPTDTTNYNSVLGTTVTINVNKATPSLSVMNSPVTYDGAAHAALVTSSVAGLVSNILTGGAATQTNAGTYAVTADFTSSDTNYTGLTGAPAGDFVIDKATPSLSVTNSPVTYDGAAHAALVTGSVAGLVSNTLTGGAATQTNAGTYAVTADFTSSDTNYTDLTGVSAGNFVIDKATPSLSVTNSPVTYDGAAHAALVTSSVAGLVSNILTGGAATQTNVGTYAVTADFTSSDTNYTDLTGASAGNFVIIGKAVPTLTTSSGPFTYDATPHAATVLGSVAGTVSNIRYNGSLTVPINAGTYMVTADFLPSDTTTYEILIGASAGSIIINKATPNLSVTNSPVTYDGAMHAALVTSSVAGSVSNILTGGAATQTNAGTYAVTADFTSSDTNYTDLTGASAGDFVIDKATPSLSVTNSPATYDGVMHAALVTSSVAGSVSNILTGGAATQTNVGTYAVTADFTSNNANYTDLTSASAGNFVINKAWPIVTWNNPVDITFGTALSDTQLNATASVAGTFVYSPAAGTVLNAGPGQILSVDFIPTDSANYNSVLGTTVTINVNKAILTNTPGKATGGGNLDLPGGKITFGFVIRYVSGALSPAGNLTFNDRGENISLKATSFTQLNISGNHAVITGYATVNGEASVAFNLNVEDFGEPGSSDTFMIQIPALNGYSAEGVLTGGNIQVTTP